MKEAGIVMVILGAFGLPDQWIEPTIVVLFILLVGALVLYYRLWTSIANTDIQRLEKEREAMCKAKDRMEEINTNLQNRNEELARQVGILVREVEGRDGLIQNLRDLKDQMARTIEAERDKNKRLEESRAEQQEKVEWLIGRVVQMDAERGIVTKLDFGDLKKGDL